MSINERSGMLRFQYHSELEREQILLHNASNRLAGEQQLIEGNYLIFEGLSKENQKPGRSNFTHSRSSRWKDTLTVNPIVVRVTAERILSGGMNLKTGEVYLLDDITNPDYRVAVENYILLNTDGV